MMMNMMRFSRSVLCLFWENKLLPCGRWVELSAESGGIRTNVPTFFCRWAQEVQETQQRLLLGAEVKPGSCFRVCRYCKAWRSHSSDTRKGHTEENFTLLLTSSQVFTHNIITSWLNPAPRGEEVLIFRQSHSLEPAALTDVYFLDPLTHVWMQTRHHFWIKIWTSLQSKT